MNDNDEVLIQNTDHDPDYIIFGFPMDITCLHRRGTKDAPSAIRRGLNEYYEYHYRYKVDPYSHFRFIDRGNVTLSDDVVESINIIEQEIKTQIQKYPQAKVIALGGEHLITYPIIKAFNQSLTLVVFDAHLDLNDTFAGSEYNHATHLRRIYEATPCKDIIHIGLRDCSNEELDFADQHITYFDIDSDLNQIKETLSGIKSNYYISIDVDALDPSVIPGTGIPVAGGLMYRELVGLIESLPKRINIGFDIVELAPSIDPTQRSELTVAKLLHEILSFYASE